MKVVRVTKARKVKPLTLTATDALEMLEIPNKPGMANTVGSNHELMINNKAIQVIPSITKVQGRHKRFDNGTFVV